MPRHNPYRDFVLAMYRRGELRTLEEGALIANTSRGLVQKWLAAARIDWEAQRGLYLARHRERAEHGKPRRRPTKAMLRAIADRAKAEWDRRQASD